MAVSRTLPFVFLQVPPTPDTPAPVDVVPDTPAPVAPVVRLCADFCRDGRSSKEMIQTEGTPPKMYALAY